MLPDYGQHGEYMLHGIAGFGTGITLQPTCVSSAKGVADGWSKLVAGVGATGICFLLWRKAKSPSFAGCEFAADVDNRLSLERWAPDLKSVRAAACCACVPVSEVTTGLCAGDGLKLWMPVEVGGEM
jgi:hypothetical protein